MLKTLYLKYQRWVPIAFFILGFLFDAAMLRRIDEPATLIQQAIYIVVCCFLISVDLIELVREFHPPRLLTRVWKFREALLHFLLGTLLNSYTIFYFKSSSFSTSFVFIGLLVTLLMLNEFMKFGKSQAQVHMFFLSLSIVSYLVSLIPILIGHIGAGPFIISILLSLTLYYLFFYVIRPQLNVHADYLTLVKTHIIFPFASIPSLFCLLYFTHVIPPVPLSLTYIGIYHHVEKQRDSEYIFTTTRAWWKFWQHGDQTFIAKSGDVIYCYFSIFSPKQFKDDLQVRWSYYDPRRGWVKADAIPVTISGGREQGYRVITTKSNYQPGDWRVQVETRDGREVGRIGFVVEK